MYGGFALLDHSLLPDSNRRNASVSSVSTGAKTHYIANQKRGYIEKYVNIIYALGSAHVKYDVWIEVDLLPFYSTSSVE